VLTAAELRERVLTLCPELASLAHSPLEHWDTPGPLWVKRDDRLGEGGTKLRKLLAELPAAQARGETVMTFGHLDSNHALATARFGVRLGLPVELRLLGAAGDDPKRLAVFRALAPTQLHASLVGLTLSTVWRVLVARLRGERLRRFPPGGTTALSTAAVAGSVAEVVEQFAEQGVRLPERWVVAVGSGGTLAGLLAGVRALGLSATVVGVAASSRLIGKRRVSRLANQALRLLGAPGDVRAADVQLSWKQLGGGHAKSTAESTRIQAQLASVGKELDPIFNAKALAWWRSQARPDESWLFGIPVCR